MLKYTEICKIFQLSPNDKQEKVWDALIAMGKKSFLPRKQCHGCYIYGGVGSGKTTIAKIFFDRVNTAKKIQIHLSQLMWDVNRLIDRAKKMNFRDPMLLVFKEFKHLKLIFIDEFEVNDVVSSILVRRLLEFLIKNHCKIIITSNKQPEDLYRDGLQRERFEEFVSFMKKKINIIDYDGLDYRKISAKNGNNIQISLDGDHEVILHSLVCCNDVDGLSQKSINVASRSFSVDFFEKTAILNFNEFCRKPHASQDYRAICENFTSIAMSEIPDFANEDRNSILRFCLLIDCIYEKSLKFYGVCRFDFNNFNTESRASEVPQIRRCISRMIELDRLS